MKLPSPLAHELYWLSQRARGKGEIRMRLEQLLESQYYAPSEIEKLQFEKLQQVLKHAYESVPYYRRVMQERGLTPASFTAPEDIQRLPVLTRDILLKEQKALRSTAVDPALTYSNFSSGSTGRRAEFVQDRNFKLWMRAHQLRTYGWCSRFRVGEPFVLLWGSEIYWSSKALSDELDNWLSNRREFNTFRLSRELVQSFLDKIVAFQPVLISSYTNAMNLIANEAERQGVRIPSLRAIQGTSEPLPPAVRERYASVFQCEVYDKYGSRETNVVSHECPNHEDMHIQAENAFVEFLDDKGAWAPAGETGQLHITTLNNMAMPLIRYQTQDLASRVSGSCSCGMGLPRMSSVAGRIQDLIHTPSGDSIDAYFFSYLIMRFPEIDWFQVVQHELDELLIRVVSYGGLRADLREELVSCIHRHTGFPFKIQFEILPEMPKTPTGKFRLCVSELKKAS